jgi:hypothetical protein
MPVCKDCYAKNCQGKVSAFWCGREPPGLTADSPSAPRRMIVGRALPSKSTRANASCPVGHLLKLTNREAPNVGRSISKLSLNMSQHLSILEVVLSEERNDPVEQGAPPTNLTENTPITNTLQSAQNGPRIGTLLSIYKNTSSVIASSLRGRTSSNVTNSFLLLILWSPMIS